MTQRLPNRSIHSTLRVMANHSGMLQMGFLALGIWLITTDPVEKLLPVPMPDLIAGPETTRLDGVVIRDGIPDFASVIDARDHARLTSPHNLLGAIAAAVGISQWSASEQALIEPWLLGRKPLPPAPIFNKEKQVAPVAAGDDTTAASLLAHLDTTADIAIWEKGCAPALAALRALPEGELVIPLALRQSTSAVKRFTAGDQLVLGLFNLASAEVAAGMVAAQQGDRHGIASANAMVSRIAGWLVDSRQPFAFAEALQLQVMLREAWLSALAVHGSATMCAAVREWNAALPSYDPRPTLGETVRLAQLTITASRCAQFRQQDPTTDNAKLIRRNAPPDPNVALNEVQMACDAADLVLDQCPDIAALAALDEKKLPQFRTLVEESFDHRPLAERMLFRNPIALRRAFIAKRFASLAIVEVQQHHRRVVSRAKALIRRQAAVNVALAVCDHHARTGTLPSGASDLPAALQPVFAAGDTAITLTCTSTDCTIVTTGDKPVTLWHYTLSPPASTP